MDIKLGSKVKDNLTGFVGYAVARCEYLNGCIQYEIEPEQLKDGRPQKSYWLDVQRIEQIQVAKKSPTKTGIIQKHPTAHCSGGPQNHPDEKSPPSLAGYEEDAE